MDKKQKLISEALKAAPVRQRKPKIAWFNELEDFKSSIQEALNRGVGKGTIISVLHENDIKISKAAFNSYCEEVLKFSGKKTRRASTGLTNKKNIGSGAIPQKPKFQIPKDV